jgi:hypothetical protein
MHWRRRAGGEEYLYHIVGKAEHSFGPRNPQTERIKADHDSHRYRLKRATLDGRIRRIATRAMNTDCRAAAKEVMDTKLARETKAGSSRQLCLSRFGRNEKKARAAPYGTQALARSISPNHQRSTNF